MPKIVYLNEARQISLSKGYDQIMRLNPGRNIVPDDIFDAVSEEKSFKDMVDNDLIVVQGDKLDITTMDNRRAIRVIDLETTVQGVQELLNQEAAATKPRTNVMAAANAKIDAITEALKAKEKADRERAKKEAGGDNA